MARRKKKSTKRSRAAKRRWSKMSPASRARILAALKRGRKKRRKGGKRKKRRSSKKKRRRTGKKSRRTGRKKSRRKVGKRKGQGGRRKSRKGRKGRRKGRRGGKKKRRSKRVAWKSSALYKWIQANKGRRRGSSRFRVGGFRVPRRHAARMRRKAELRAAGAWSGAAERATRQAAAGEHQSAYLARLRAKLASRSRLPLPG
jgi:hypothetical protein